MLEGRSPELDSPDVEIEGAERPVAVVTPSASCHSDWRDRAAPCREGTAHIILEVTDHGEPALTRYRRIILQTK